MTDFPRIHFRDVPATDKPFVGEVTIQMNETADVRVVPLTAQSALQIVSQLSHQLARRSVLPDWQSYLPGHDEGEGA